jgi:hypothetical protein
MDGTLDPRPLSSCHRLIRLTEPTNEIRSRKEERNSLPVLYPVAIFEQHDKGTRVQRQLVWLLFSTSVRHKPLSYKATHFYKATSHRMSKPLEKRSALVPQDETGYGRIYKHIVGSFLSLQNLLTVH